MWSTADVAATPTTGVLVRQLQAAGGIQISASHNPAQYNGLKLFSAEGRVIPEAAGAKVLERYRRPTAIELAARRPGKRRPCADTVIATLRGSSLDTVDVERIRRRRFQRAARLESRRRRFAGSHAAEPSWAAR